MPFVFRRRAPDGEVLFLKFYRAAGERRAGNVRDLRDATRFDGRAPAAHKGKLDGNWRPVEVRA